ncbi:MAG: amidohydrolase family protein [Propionibacteriaceae bacterium]|jgi:N-acetylglucosamine-6-phosphate deacetylase|nr:amidohydrolase family protein [Propionibacteriaceae bacterium]
MIVTGNIWQEQSDTFEQGWLEASDGRVVANHRGVYDGEPDLALEGFVAPGFVDVHCHGGGGGAFTDGEDSANDALTIHSNYGTTTMVASLVSEPIPTLIDQINSLLPWIRDGYLAGIHLEGPWLSPLRKGAHALENLALPTPEALQPIVDVGPGVIKMVTIAPELDGAPAAIQTLTDAGIVVAIGHTQADYDTTMEAFRLGATGMTHLFNAMPDMTKRDPGPILAGFTAGAWLELIFDNHHVDPHLAAFICRTFPERTVFVTDAMAAAGLGDGHYSLGSLPVTVAGGVARLDSDGAIAGSTITMKDAVRNAVAAGVPLGLAVRFATLNPATYLGLTGVGSLSTGSFAHLLVLDETGSVKQIVYPT